MMDYFKINLLIYDSHTPTFHLINTFLPNSFLPCITHLTRISNNSITIIHNILNNLTDTNITSGSILTHLSGHFPQFLILKKTKISYRKLELFKRDYSSFEGRNFLNEFTILDLKYLNNDSDFN